MSDKYKFRGFDIETTGLIASRCEIVSFSVGPDCRIQNSLRDESGLIKNINMNVGDGGLLTFMGGTKYGPGFDFPFMRTRCAILGVPWPFGGVPHIDILPIIQKRFDTKISYSPGIEDLGVDELKEMMKSFDIRVKAKKKQEFVDVIQSLCESGQIADHIADNCGMKTKDVNSLKETYQLLTGEDPGDMRGDMVPMLWKQFLETHDNTILDDIMNYNREDCRKTEVLWEIVQGCCPSRDFMPEIL